jgi:acyl-CoA-binding protein
MVSRSQFDAAAVEAKSLPKASNDEMLELYGWFKQANVGDVDTGACQKTSPPNHIFLIS